MQPNNIQYILRTIFSRFGIKVGIAAGAVYYLKEQGVFRSSDEAHQVYGKINNALQPYVQEVKKQLPVQVNDAVYFVWLLVQQ